MPDGYHPNWVRLCAAVDGFRWRYGHWPTRVRMRPGMIATLRDYAFTPEDYARITAKISLIPANAVIAEDDSGASYDYGREGFPEESPTPSAYEWFGVSPKSYQT